MKLNFYIIFIVISLFSCNSQPEKNHKEIDDKFIEQSRDPSEPYRFLLKALQDSGYIKKSTMGLSSVLNKQSLNPEGKRIDRNEAELLTFLFNNIYEKTKTEFSNKKHRINLDLFLETIGYEDIKNKQETGYCFYHIIHNGSYSVIVIKAERKSDSKIYPLKTGNVYKYLKVCGTDVTVHEDTDLTTISTAKDDYLNKVYLFNEYHKENKVDTLRHPGQCFYSGIKLFQFLVDNNVPSVSPRDGYEMKIENVVSKVSNVSPTNSNRMLLVHNVLQVLVLNDNDIYSSQMPSGFEGHAMNVGYLCPPQCN